MAAIVDTNVLHKILASRESEEGDGVFRSWITSRRGLLVYAVTDAYKKELRENKAVMEVIKKYSDRGHTRLVKGDVLSEARKKLQENKSVCSNDLHVLALALAGKALILCSYDKDLREDFKNKNVLPQVGRKPRALYPIDAAPKERKRFLNRHQCPRPHDV